MSLVSLYVNGRLLRAAAGLSVAAVLAQAGVPARRSVSGEPRAPFCGMGVCFECRVRIDGRAHVRACLTPVQEGMRVETDDQASR